MTYHRLKEILKFLKEINKSSKTKIMSMKETDNASTTEAKAIRATVYKIHTNKYIEHFPNKPTTTTSISNGHV